MLTIDWLVVYTPWSIIIVVYTHWGYIIDGF